MKPAAPGTWKCDCGAANAERYQNCWRCRRHRPRRKAITSSRRAARYGNKRSTRPPARSASCEDFFKNVVPAVADVERQATSDDFERSRYAVVHAIFALHAQSHIGQARERGPQKREARCFAPDHRQQTMLQATGCEFAGVC